MTTSQHGPRPHGSGKFVRSGAIGRCDPRRCTRTLTRPLLLGPRRQVISGVGEERESERKHGTGMNGERSSESSTIMRSFSPCSPTRMEGEQHSSSPLHVASMLRSDLMRHPKYNKGMAFSDAERDRLYLRGLLPPAILSQEVQVERTLLNIRSMQTNLEKHTYLSSLQERNQRLFYRQAETLHTIKHRSPRPPHACTLEWHACM
jgi:hypothetical protein